MPTLATAQTTSRPEPKRRAAASNLIDDRLAKGDRDRMRARIGLELGQDVAHVALDRLLADEELLGHVRVGHAVREQLQDLALPPGEHVVALAAREEGRHERGVDVTLAARDLLDRPYERLVRGLLEDVA